MEPPAYESVLKVPYFCFRSRNYIHFVVVLCSWAWRSSWYTGEVGGSIEEKTLVSDWFKKLAPSSRPIRSKTHSNYNSLEVVFPRSASAACIYVEFWLVHYIVCPLWLAWHPIKNCSKLNHKPNHRKRKIRNLVFVLCFLQLFLASTTKRRVRLFVPVTFAFVAASLTTSLHIWIVFSFSLVGEVFDVLGDKMNVAFDDLAKLHQLGLVKCFFH